MGELEHFAVQRDMRSTAVTSGPEAQPIGLGMTLQPTKLGLPGAQGRPAEPGATYSVPRQFAKEPSVAEDETVSVGSDEDRKTQSIRLDGTSEHPSYIGYGIPGRGRIVDNHYSGPRATESRDNYRPYRKAEQVLGAQIDHPALSEADDSPTLGNQGRQENFGQAQKPQAPVNNIQSPNVRQLSPRSKRLPLSSHPVEPRPDKSRKASNPASPSKRISYELPPININGRNNFSRQMLARSPYPPINQVMAQKPRSADLLWDSTITLVLYGHNKGLPRHTRVVIPGSQIFSEKVDRPENAQELSSAPFDDEQLFIRMRQEYQKLRSPMRRLLSLQKLKSLNLISWTPASAAGSGEHNLTILNPSAASSLPETDPWKLFQNPKLGRGQSHFIRWITNSSPHHPDNDMPSSAEIAVEFLEGWHVWRTLLISVAVWLFSAAAGASWILFGVNPDGRQGLESAATRVNTGVLLSGVVLLMGWSFIAVWTLLSWMTC